MQTIFRALRALCRNKGGYLSHENARLDNLQVALHHFERTNRGHQHELTDLALAASESYYRGGTPQFRARIYSFRDSLRYLLQALARTPIAILPHHAAFKAFIEAEDDTGLLDRMTLQFLEGSLRGALQMPSDFEMSLSLQREGEQLSVKASYRHRKHPALTAERAVMSPLQPITTLEGFAVTMRMAARELQEKFCIPERFPEFSNAHQTAALGDESRRKMKDFLKSCTPEQQSWIAANWQSLKPYDTHLKCVA